jgi:hypothetical protein
MNNMQHLLPIPIFFLLIHCLQHTTTAAAAAWILSIPEDRTSIQHHVSATTTKAIARPGTVAAWHSHYNNNNLQSSSMRLFSSTDAEIEQQPSATAETKKTGSSIPSRTQTQADIPTSTTTTSATETTISNNPLLPRGKVNEIDFCIAPADVSLSRAYANFFGSNSNDRGDTTTSSTKTTATSLKEDAAVGLSLTRALNNASNRAVRRILLARSWPSAEALNRSLRQMAKLEQKNSNAAVTASQPSSSSSSSSTSAKCPIPRPILNVLTRSSNNSQKEGTVPSSDIEIDDSVETPKKKIVNIMRMPKPRSRTDEEYIADQIQSFRNAYGTLPGYTYAEEYLDCVLSLATSGYESEKVRDVLAHGIYDEAYKRVLSVLRSVGVEFEIVTATDDQDGTQNNKKRRKIASKLKDQDICWGLLDKIQIRKEIEQHRNQPTTNGVAFASKVSAVKQIAEDTEDMDAKKKTSLRFWQKKEGSDKGDTNQDTGSDDDEGEELTGDDLGGLLLSANEPTMTRQLNVLSNIVLRALLFGGDQELLVLAETLDADRAAFVDRWYPGTSKTTAGDDKDVRPGVQYLNCLILLLRKCYNDGLVTDMNPPLSLRGSYANSYERLVANAVERGSGYIKPMVGGDSVALVTSMPKPRTAQEELGRFAVWETNFRQAAAAAAQQNKSPHFMPYPDDLVGTWEVRDVIGGDTIGTSIVTFIEGGDVQVSPPLEGLRWRLDPGPTHLDTCTFQVLSTLDGTILQYRGFIDRGARLESRFSKRPISIRGSVMFQMRDGSIDYFKDMLPINYRTGTTKFIMTKSV